MIRIRRRRTTFFGAFVATVVAAAYGCGSDGGSSSSGGVDPDGSLPEGAVVLPDGNVILPDGTVTTDTGTDAPKTDGGDGASDSPVDTGVDVLVEADAEAGVVDPPGPLSPGYVDYDVNHILVAGQSNSVASGSSAPLSTTQPFTNLKFNTGLFSMHGSPTGAAGDQCNGNGCTKYQIPASFDALRQTPGEAFFGNAAGTETIAPGMANQISYLATTKYEFGIRAGYPTKHDVLSSVHGRSGNEYICIRKGGCQYMRDRGATLEPFQQGTVFTSGPYINHGETRDGYDIAVGMGKTYVVRAVALVHGESDHYAYVDNPNYDHPNFPNPGTGGGAVADYGEALLELQRDYDAAVKGITGQAQDVLLMYSGVSGYTRADRPAPGFDTLPFSPLANMQLAAQVNGGQKVLYVAPGYPFASLSDCNHYSNHGMRRLGEYFGKVYARVVFGGEVWEPVRPQAIVRAGTVIDVDFYVPNPPLAFDTTQVVATPNMGFDFYDAGVKKAIASVVLTGPTSVRITLAAAPSGGANMRLMYAQNELGPGMGCIGPGTVNARGAAGNLRDSDNTPSYYNDAAGNPYSMYNWGVPFDEPVP